MKLEYFSLILFCFGFTSSTKNQKHRQLKQNQFFGNRPQWYYPIYFPNYNNFRPSSTPPQAPPYPIPPQSLPPQQLPPQLQPQQPPPNLWFFPNPQNLFWNYPGINPIYNPPSITSPPVIPPTLTPIIPNEAITENSPSTTPPVPIRMPEKPVTEELISELSTSTSSSLQSLVPIIPLQPSSPTMITYLPNITTVKTITSTSQRTDLQTSKLTSRTPKPLTLLSSLKSPQLLASTRPSKIDGIPYEQIRPSPGTTQSFKPLLASDNSNSTTTEAPKIITKAPNQNSLEYLVTSPTLMFISKTEQELAVSSKMPILASDEIPTSDIMKPSQNLEPVLEEFNEFNKINTQEMLPDNDEYISPGDRLINGINNYQGCQNNRYHNIDPYGYPTRNFPNYYAYQSMQPNWPIVSYPPTPTEDYPTYGSAWPDYSSLSPKLPAFAAFKKRNN